MAPMTRVLEWKDTGFLRKDSQGKRGGGVALCVNDQLECIQLRSGVDEEPTKSLRVRIKGRAGIGDIIVGGLLQAT